MAKQKEENTSKNNLMDKVISLCKRRGFVFPGSEIYGGLANTWDFGPLGVQLKRSIKKNWWKTFVETREDIFGIDGGILLSPKIWEASGHVEGFTDPLVDCKSCKKRFRADQLSEEDFTKCPECGGKLTSPRLFNAMFKTFIGAVEDENSVAYLRPETAQAIFVNFKNIVGSFHPNLPFGIAQIGKAFRNEITAGKFIFRTLEFEQMEIEYFIREDTWQKTFESWKKQMEDWVVSLGVSRDKLRFREHQKDELSHYSKKTVDLEYEFPFGFKELYGLAYRTDFDLKNHAKFSGKDLRFIDSENGEKFFPHVVEPSFGVERTMLPILLDSYWEDNNRVVLQLKPELAPYKVAVFPLLANKPELVKKARGVFEMLKNPADSSTRRVDGETRRVFLGGILPIAWDDRGNIGKRYYAQDEIGTPWCVTIDFETLEDDTVTIRDRDTTEQKRFKTSELVDEFKERLSKK